MGKPPEKHALGTGNLSAPVLRRVAETISKGPDWDEAWAAEFLVVLVNATHVGTEGNELADRMAMLGPQRKEELRPYQGKTDILF